MKKENNEVKNKRKEVKGKEEGRVRFVILNIIRALLVIAFVGALYNERDLVLIISVIAFILTFLPYLFRKFFDIELPAQFEVIVILFIYGTLFFGRVKGLNTEFWWWSASLSVASSIALGFVGLAVMYSLYKEDKVHGSPFMIALFAFCFAVAVGAVWEFFEFGMDRLFGFNMQESSDTMIDLVANIFGAFVVSGLGYYYIKNGRVVFISTMVRKFVERNPKIFKNKNYKDEENLLDMIKKGEKEGVEFKSTMRKNLYTNQMDKRIEHSILKTVAAYLNSSGGILLIGVDDKGEIIGLEQDDFENIDKANLHFNALVKDNLGGAFLPFVSSSILEVNGKKVLKIDCKKSNNEVFLKQNGEEHFYVRNGPSTVKLDGKALVDYVYYSFRNKEN